MKIIQHNNGIVVDIRNARDDADASNIAVVPTIPVFEPREGFNGILKYNTETGLYWDYEVVPVSDEISDAEALNIILGGDGE